MTEQPKVESGNPYIAVIIDGQYGSCGKGAICGYLANEFNVAVRVGAPNAGHTVKVGDRVWKMQQIPVAGLINPDITLCIGAAGLLNLEVLNREMDYIRDCASRLYIDRNAGVVEEHHKKQEEEEKMFEGIGSTCEGVGAARRDKIKRNGKFLTAKDVPELDAYIINVAKYINTLPNNKKVMIEGTQGYALSMNHGPYPYCTSVDVLASSILSDVGLAPSMCDDVIMVIRTYPIRVFGNSGPMCGEEISWEEVQRRSGCPTSIEERTTVTKRVRRVCEFDMKLVKEAILLNRPTQLALTFMDYIDYMDYGEKSYGALSKKSKAFISMVEDETGLPVTFIKTGPDNRHMIDRRINFPAHGTSPFDEGNNI